jgi:hypothetical protein
MEFEQEVTEKTEGEITINDYEQDWEGGGRYRKIRITIMIMSKIGREGVYTPWES